MFQGWEPAYVWGGAAMLVTALGAFVLMRNPGRGLNRTFFSLSILHAAAMVISARAALDPGSTTTLAWTRVFYYIDPWLSALIILLALHVPTLTGWAARRPVALHLGVLSLPAVVVAFYAYDPGLVIQPAMVNGVAIYTPTVFGAALIGVRGLVVAGALLIVAHRFRTTPYALQRTQLAWVQVALLVGFVPVFGIFLASQLLLNPESLATIGFAVGTVLMNAVTLWVLRPWNTALFSDPDRQVVGVTYVASTGVALAVILLGSGHAVQTFLGIVSLAYPLLLGYAILKFDLFNLDLRIRRTTSHMAFGFSILSVFALFLGITTNVSPSSHIASQIVAASVLTAAISVPVHSATTSLTTRLGAMRELTADSVNARRTQLYRAAVENVVSRNEDVDQSEDVRDLRKHLNISHREHEDVVRRVQADLLEGAWAPRGPLREGDFVMRKYRVDRFLGAGSFGRAVLATHVGVDRQVVIKEPHEALRSRSAPRDLLREARLAGRVRHANVVALLDYEELDGAGYLVFEHVDGGSLEDRLKNGALPRAEAHRLFREMLAGLDAIHRARVVHMDLKPANVLLTDDGTAKIADFGIAREIRMKAATLARSAGPQAHPGTLLYMAPEQVRGRRDPGLKADLYAAGAIFHEMLTGKRYLDFPESAPLIQDAILYREPRLDDPNLTPAEQDLLQALLAKAPADRPASAHEVLDHLPPMDVASAARWSSNNLKDMEV